MQLAGFILGLVMVVATGIAADGWPQFRGPGGDGHSEAKGLPLEWSETKNVKDRRINNCRIH